MTEEEARLILESYRPGTGDESDPQFAAALREAERNPQLARWLAEEQAFDRAVAAKLAALPEPLGLKTRILAHGAPARAPRWSLAAALAAIAALLFLGAQVVSLFRAGGAGPTHATDYAREMVSFIRLDPALDVTSHDLGSITAWLAKNERPPGNIPAPLVDLQPLGCRILSFRGHDVTLICFRRANGGLAHLLLVDRAALPEMRPGQPPRFARMGDWSTGCWAEGQRVYLVAVRGDLEAVKQYLPRA